MISMITGPVATSTGENTSVSPCPHILLVIDQFPKAFGGGERIVLKLASLLPRYGYRVSILTFFAHPQSPLFLSATCPVYVLPLKRTYGFEAAKAAFHLKLFLAKHDIQIVQTFFESSDVWAGTFTKLLSGAKLIWSRRDMGILRGRKHRIAYRLLSKIPDAVFAVSEQVRRYSIDVDGVDPERVITVYNGLDLSAWASPERSAVVLSRACIVTTGNIRKVKGHDIFVRAARLVVNRFPSATFKIAGEVMEEDYYHQLLSLVKELGLAGQFQFVGGVNELPPFLAAADIFVLPSRSEGFSNAIIEAMAAELPVIATTVGGNAEAIQDGISGILIPPDNPELLANAIIRMLSDPAQARAMGRAGREFAARTFTIEAMMENITSVYKTLLSDK